jgi:glycine dehydrogenase
MAGLRVVPVNTLADGNLDLADLRSKAEQHKDKLAALMVSSRTIAPILTDLL